MCDFSFAQTCVSVLDLIRSLIRIPANKVKTFRKWKFLHTRMHNDRQNKCSCRHHLTWGSEMVSFVILMMFKDEQTLICKGWWKPLTWWIISTWDIFSDHMCESRIFYSCCTLQVWLVLVEKVHNKWVLQKEEINKTHNLCFEFNPIISVYKLLVGLMYKLNTQIFSWIYWPIKYEVSKTNLKKKKFWLHNTIEKKKLVLCIILTKAK